MTVLTKNLSFEGGSIVPPWAEVQVSATHTASGKSNDAAQYGVASGNRFPGFSKYAFTKIIPPAYATNSGWHARCFPAYYGPTDIQGAHPGLVGDEVWIRGAFYLPSNENTNGQYRGDQIIEFLHPNDWPQVDDPSKNCVHAQIAQFMLHVNRGLETWDGQAFHTYGPKDNCLVFRIATGYVPGLPSGGPHDQTYWHSNIVVLDPVPMDIPIWFILHIIFHEYAGGNPPG